jgi:antitoxin CptB
MIDPNRLRRMKFRAWHRGTREADYVVGGFFDTFHATWSEPDCVWFEALLDEQDVDILGWALGTIAVPDAFAGPQMALLCQLDYVEIPR